MCQTGPLVPSSGCHFASDLPDRRKLQAAELHLEQYKAKPGQLCGGLLQNAHVSSKRRMEPSVHLEQAQRAAMLLLAQASTPAQPLTGGTSLNICAMACLQVHTLCSRSSCPSSMFTPPAYLASCISCDCSQHTQATLQRAADACHQQVCCIMGIMAQDTPASCSKDSILPPRQRSHQGRPLLPAAPPKYPKPAPAALVRAGSTNNILPLRSRGPITTMRFWYCCCCCAAHVRMRTRRRALLQCIR